MTPRTEVSVCERETTGKTKCKLLGSEIVTELEVSQFFLENGKPHMSFCGVGEVFGWPGSEKFGRKWAAEWRRN